jgi:hypothetical protein
MTPTEPIKPSAATVGLYKVRRKKRTTRDSRTAEQVDKKDAPVPQSRGKRIDDLA